MKDKIKTIDEMKEIISVLKKQGKKIATTNGSFDLLHIGHIYVLESAKRLTDVLIILLNSDSSVKRLKGEGRPIVSEKERAEVISSLDSVDYVIIFDEDEPLDVIKQIKPDIHIKGGLFIPEKVQQETELIESWGGKHITLPLVKGYATTNIINQVLKNYNRIRKESSNKILKLDELKRLVEAYKKENKKIVFTNGCYDILHPGHFNTLIESSKYGDILIVALNSDSSVKKFKGENRPFFDQASRSYMVQSIKGVNHVIIFDDENVLGLLREIKPDVLVKGGNPLPERVAAEREIVESYGGKVVLLPLIEDFSTTKTIEKIKSVER